MCIQPCSGSPNLAAVSIPCLSSRAHRRLCRAPPSLPIGRHNVDRPWGELAGRDSRFPSGRGSPLRYAHAPIAIEQQPADAAPWPWLLNVS
ncbi:hypothetical protein PVAP13_1KG393115 [Panicum virgatum]|uniref:Uncharacterized protein n=1 Tax=Panicum virgatum TaxID=38727 RepID=A0A8T0XSC5_PANVG|nr:hypothetical protein PVAP13_1KG393115 [Panicum virgatum]